MVTYTGIGSRSTPPAILALMERIGMLLARRGYTLRSGGAEGADAAFERGCDAARGRKEIYLPWPLFNDHPSALHTISDEAFALAARFHPAWTSCTSATRKLHARNGYQVLGADLATPSAFVVCWTKDAAGGGGTGQAIRIARHTGVRVYDLAHPEDRAFFENRLAHG